MEPITQSLALRLKGDTLELHRKAEQQPLPGALMRGELPREKYLDYLGQRLLVHRELERGLSAFLEREPRWRSLVQPYHFQEPYLLNDLAQLGVDPESFVPLEATRQATIALRQAADAAPPELIGHLYVHEGSKNGARYMTRGVSRAYGLEDGRGMRYLDPHGDLQMARWSAFKVALDALALDKAACGAILEGARAAFHQIIEIDAAILA